MNKFSYLNSYFEVLLGLEYFDGPMVGVGSLPDKTSYYFTILGWDSEHSERVFALAAIPNDAVSALFTALEAVEPAKKPRWYVQSTGVGQARVAIDKAITVVRDEAMRSGFRRLVQSQDLVGPAIQVDLTYSEVHALNTIVIDNKIAELMSRPILAEFISANLKSL